MFALRTVLCPVDFSPATSRQVDIAADLCQAFGGKLVVHHNRHSLGTGASIGWMWNADHQRETPEALDAKMKDCLARVPPGVQAEPLITEGPVTRAVLAVGQALKADLVVMTTHGRMLDDHASLTEQMIEHGERPVLVLHEPKIESRTPRFASRSEQPQVVVAPTDLAAESSGATSLAMELARTLPIELHLLHLLPNGRRGTGAAEEEARGRMQAMVPDDLRSRVQVHVQHAEHRDAAGDIAAAADRLSASCIVIGEHTKLPVRRWFSRESSTSVLRQAHCPVWYVPSPVVV